MPLNRVSEELRAEKHADDLRRHRQASRGQTPRIVNTRPVLWLRDPTRWPFRGKLWEVPPIPLRDAVRVLEFQMWAISIAERKNLDGFAEEYHERMSGAIKLIRRCVVPERGRIRRLLWRLRLLPNPWRSATDSEVSELLGFFSALRTTSLDHLAAGAAIRSTS